MWYDRRWNPVQNFTDPIAQSCILSTPSVEDFSRSERFSSSYKSYDEQRSESGDGSGGELLLQHDGLKDHAPNSIGDGRSPEGSSSELYGMLHISTSKCAHDFARLKHFGGENIDRHIHCKNGLCEMEISHCIVELDLSLSHSGSKFLHSIETVLLGKPPFLLLHIWKNCLRVLRHSEGRQ